MKIKNKELIQSYIITTARYDFNAYEKRILTTIVELLQEHTKGRKLNIKHFMNQDLFGDKLFKMPISYFLHDENDKNYSRYKTAFKRLKDKTFEFDDGNNWAYISIVESPEIYDVSKGDSGCYVTFRLNRRVYDAFLDFSKGYRKFESQVSKGFSSEYTMRFYELFSGKNEPIIYSIVDLKKMFSKEDKYKNKPNDFFRNVIDAAQKELTEKSPYSFKYEKIKTGRSYTHIKFKPFFIPKNRDEELEKKSLLKDSSVRWDFSKDDLLILKDKFNLTDDGIKNNRELLIQAINNSEYKDWVAEINGMARKYDIGNVAGFFISELKKKLENEKNNN
jgi:plasmid replication initiation protein